MDPYSNYQPRPPLSEPYTGVRVFGDLPGQLDERLHGKVIDVHVSGEDEGSLYVPMLDQSEKDRFLENMRAAGNDAEGLRVRTEELEAQSADVEFRNLSEMTDEGIDLSRREMVRISCEIPMDRRTRATMRWMHSVLALLYLAAGVVSLLPVKSFTGYTYQGFAFFDRAANRYMPGDVSVGSVRVDGLPPFFLLGPFAVHLLAAVSTWGVAMPFLDYVGQCARRINPLQWIACAVSLPLTALVVALSLGAAEATTLALIAVCTFCGSVLCLSIDYIQYFVRSRAYAAEGKVIYSDVLITVYVPLMCASALFACAWSVLVAYGTVSDGEGGALPRWAIACLWIGFAQQLIIVGGEFIAHAPLHPTRRFFGYVITSAVTLFVGNVTIAGILFFSNLD